MITKWSPWLIGVLIAGGLGWWAVKGMTDLPGVAVADQGRDHKSREENDKFTYNSNPPTSGPHDADWIRSGTYDTPQDKYKLIHSLEHGYIIAHFNCAISNPKSEIRNPKQILISNFQITKTVKAHEDPGDLDRDSTPSAVFKADCSLAQVLADWAKKNGLKRIIVQPNPEIDKPVVLVAWGRILKMDNWNEPEATKFARTFHNKGPEQTME